MTKWTKTRRDPGRTYVDENAERVRREQRDALRSFVEEGYEAEPKYLALLKVWLPEITKEQLLDRIMRFRAAVRQHEAEKRK